MPRRSGPSDDEIRRRIREAITDDHPELTEAEVRRRAREKGVEFSADVAADHQRLAQDQLDEAATEEGRS